MSSTRQMPPMDAARRMLIARARDREQLRNQVICESQGVLTEAEIETRVEQILFERRSSGGRTSAANRAAEREAVKKILAAAPAALVAAENAVAQLQMLAALAEDVA